MMKLYQQGWASLELDGFMPGGRLRLHAQCEFEAGATLDISAQKIFERDVYATPSQPIVSST
jgi:hypothetical protein